MRGLPADIVFVQGVPEHRDIPLTIFFAPITGLDGFLVPHSETWIQSTLSSVAIQGPCYAITDCLAPPPPGIPFQFVVALDTYGGTGSTGYDKSITLSLQYDGTGSAGDGTVDILATTQRCDVCSITFRNVGSINVHVVAPSFTNERTNFQVYSSSPVSNFFYLYNSWLDGHPDAILIVSPVQEYTSPIGQPTTTYLGEPVGVWYSTYLQRWSIYNESGAPMTAGQRYNVSFAGYAGQNSYVHVTDSSNTRGSLTILNDSRLNALAPPDPTPSGNPYARAFITHVWNPPGHQANYFPFKVGLWYNRSIGKWTIYREDRGNMPLGATFNVVVSAAPAYVGVYDTVTIWPMESPPEQNQDQLVHFTHLWASPFSSSVGTYYQYVPVARHVNWCLPPPFYCVSTTDPGNYRSNASSSDYFFNRWVPLDAQ